MSTVRTFVAVRVPAMPPLLEALGRLRQMGRAVKAVAPENLHFTLRFLGELDHEQLAAIGRAVRASVAGLDAFEMTLHGVGCFPNERRPAVVWAGVADETGGERLGKIAGRLSDELELIGYGREERAFSAHLTLARIKARPPAALGTFLKAHREAAFGPIAVKQVEVMTSKLLPTGPQYSVVGVGELGERREGT